MLFRSPNCDAAKVPSATAYCMTVGVKTGRVTATADGWQVAAGVTATTVSGSVSDANLTLTAAETPAPQSQQCVSDAGCRTEYRGSRIVVTVPPGAVDASAGVITITVKETTDSPETATVRTALRTTAGVPMAIDITVREIGRAHV